MFNNGGEEWGPAGINPLLFLIYLNSLSLVSITGKFIFFADDDSIVSFGKDAEDLLVVKTWCDANGLSFNTYS